MDMSKSRADPTRGGSAKRERQCSKAKDWASNLIGVIIIKVQAPRQTLIELKCFEIQGEQR